MYTAIFDIDGTLADTMDVDAECLIEALRLELDITMDRSWGGVEDLTDANILNAAMRSCNHLTASDTAERRVIDRFVQLMRDVHAETPTRFRATPGARAAFAEARGAGWRPILATGAWRESAEFKLAAADIDHADIPLSTSSERRTRVEILEHALANAGTAPGPHVLYFGDGVWDLRAAKTLGLSFVGVGAGAAADTLTEAGAPTVIPDLRDLASAGRHVLATATRAV